MLQKNPSPGAEPEERSDDSRVVRTLQRGLEVLRAFRSEPKPLGNKTIADRTGIPKPTVTRITHTLVALGYLTRVSNSGQFQLGEKILGLGRAFLETSEIRKAARGPMQQLACRLGISVGLAVAHRDHMLFVLWYRSPKTVTLRLRPGSLLPMNGTAVGKACLWALPPEERCMALARIKRECGIKSVESILRAFEDLDHEGYCVAIAEFQRNAFGIAVPIVLTDGRIMVLSCGGAALDLSESRLRETIAPQILMTADLIRQALGEPVVPDDGRAGV